MHTPRLLEHADIPAYRTLRLQQLTEAPRSSGASPGDDPIEADDYLQNLIDDPAQHLLIIDHPTHPGQLAAAAGLRRYPGIKVAHRAMIWGVYTTPSCRRMGYARATMEYAIQTAKQWGPIRYLCLSVAADSDGAIALYQSLGFQPWGTEPAVLHIDGTDHDETYMSLRL